MQHRKAAGNVPTYIRTKSVVFEILSKYAFISIVSPTIYDFPLKLNHGKKKNFVIGTARPGPRAVAGC